MNKFRKLVARRGLLASGLFAAAAGALAQARTGTGAKVLYHVDSAAERATLALGNIRNHLDLVPDAKIILVANSMGVDFLLKGAKDAHNPNVDYAAQVSALVARGVRFEVCENTMRNRHFKKDQFITDTAYTASGVVRIAQLQNEERYAYVKP